MTGDRPVIAVIGGTGPQGSGLALRWAAAGYTVIVGSRSRERAVATANELSALLPGSEITGLDNEAAASAAGIVVLTVPWASHRATLESIAPHLRAKILVDVTVPLVPPKVSEVHLPPEGAAALAARGLVGETVAVVSAFQNVSAQHLMELDHAIDCDVLVTGDDAAAKEVVLRLARDAGCRAFDAGGLANAVAAESLTAVMIALNRRYKARGAGIRLTGLPEDAAEV
jgi:NADPH-dependent F420 reductase